MEFGVLCWKEREVAQSCPIFCNPKDCSLPGSSIHGIFQARVLEWGAIAFDIFYRIPEKSYFIYSLAPLVAQMVKNLPTVQEAWVWSPGREDPLENEMRTHSSILSWKITWTREPGMLQSMESQRVRHNWVTEQQHTYCKYQEAFTNILK